MSIRKILSAVLGISIATFAGNHFASADLNVDELKVAVKSGMDQAKVALDSEVPSGSKYLEGTWVFTKRFCVSALTKDAIQNPTEVKDISKIFSILKYSADGKRGGHTVLADGDPEHHRCITETGGRYASVSVDIPLSDNLKIIEVMAGTTDLRKKIDCNENYHGPMMGQYSSVIRIDENNFYFFLPPGQLPGTPAACKNPNDFNLDLATKMPTL